MFTLKYFSDMKVVFSDATYFIHLYNLILLNAIIPK